MGGISSSVATALTLWVALAYASGCEPDPGGLRIDVTWSEGRRPDLEALGLTPFARARILDQGGVVAEGAPQPLSLGRLEVREIPYRDRLWARVEVIDGPWTNARVLYAGESSLFDFEPGEIVRREVVVGPVADPPPAPTAAIDVSGVVYERAPWGRVQEGDVSGATARVLAPPGTAPADAVEVLVLGRAEVAQAEILARGPVEGDGSFALSFTRALSAEPDRVAIAFADRGRVLTDTSTSPGIQAAWVGSVRWIANLGQKVVGEDFPNPHRLGRSRAAPEHRWWAPHLNLEVDGVALEKAAAADGVSVEAQATSTWLELSMDRPSPRAGAQMAFDEETGELVLCGGRDARGRPLTDVWRWSDRGWRQAEISGERPLARRKAAFIFHRALGGLLLYGGTTGEESLGDLWLLRGARWRRLEPTGPSPAPRANAAHAYDARRQRLVVFGGCGGWEGPCADLMGDLWAYDGTAWRALTPRGPAPSPRHGAALAYDAVADRLLLFGGYGSGELPVADRFWALSLDTLTWSELPVAADGPPPQGDVRAVHDPDRERLLLSSGIAWEPDGVMEPAGLWAWDGERWARPDPESGLVGLSDAAWAWHPGLRTGVAFGGSSSVVEDAQSFGILWDGDVGHRLGALTKEPRVSFGAAASDPSRRRIVLFGGWFLDGEGSPDTWTFDGGGWQRATLAGPDPRILSALVFFPPLGGVLLLGGWADGRVFDDAWLFDGAWRSVPIETEGGAAPPRRHRGAAAFDPAAERLVTVGCDGVWYLRLAPSGGLEWTRGPDGPPRRSSAAIVPDPANQRVVVVGGQTCDGTGTALDDVWALSSDGRWAPIATPPGFGPRFFAVATYDPRRSVVVVHGGQSGAGGFDFLDDLWELDGSTWTRPELSPSAPRRTGHMSAYDHVGGRVLMVGGLGFSGDPGYTFFFDGAHVSELRPSTSPGPRCQHRFVYREGAREGVLFGGCSQWTLHDDDGCQAVGGTWVWTGWDWRKADDPAGPDPRAYHVLLARPEQGDVLLLGGRDGRRLPGSVWSWDGRAWMREQGEARLWGGSAVWDPMDQLVVGLGGYRLPTIDVERSDHALSSWTWTAEAGLQDQGGIVERIRPAVAHDAARGEHAGFGGQQWTGPDLDETCLYRNGGWTCQRLPGPPARWNHAMAYDSARGRILLTGGMTTDPTSVVYADTWEWTGEAWREIPTPVFEPSFPSVLYDSVRRGLVAYGGFTGLGSCDDRTSFLDLDPDRRPEVRFIVDFGATREDPRTIERIEVFLVAGARGFALEPGQVTDPAPGGVVEAWDRARSAWRVLAPFDHGLERPESVVVEVTEAPGDLVAADGLVELRVRPALGNGTGLEPSAVRLDAIEARFDYRWEP